MQGGIINIIKDVWQTMKKEIGGPKINKIYVEGLYSKVENKELKNEINVNNNLFFEFVDIKDINKDSIPNIYDAVPNSNTKMILNLKDEIKVQENNILFEEILANMENKNFEIKNIEIKEKKLDKFNISVNNYFIKSGIIKCYNSKERIQKLPKKIFGKSISEISREEIEEILKAMKLKFPEKNFSKYRLYSIFKNIPIDSLKNIKYYKDINMMEIYFGNKITSKSAHFIVLEDRFTNEIDKFFL